jgi:phosphoenolpyruvate synthase/pyruvate phosphate dikinase
MEKDKQFVLWFDEISKGDVGLVGGKNANLGEMYQNLTKAESPLFKGEKINVPYGFSVTAYSYRHFISANHLDQKIKDVLKDLDTHNIKQLEEKGHKVRQMILEANFPEDLSTAIKTNPNSAALLSMEAASKAEAQLQEKPLPAVWIQQLTKPSHSIPSSESPTSTMAKASMSASTTAAPTSTAPLSTSAPPPSPKLLHCPQE